MRRIDPDRVAVGGADCRYDRVWLQIPAAADRGQTDGVRGRVTATGVHQDRRAVQGPNPGTGIEFEFAGSSELATQLTQGATADVFASADIAQMDVVAKAGLLAADPTNFASNTLVIVTAPGNPKRIGSFADLTRPG